MLERALKGSPAYWKLLISLLVIMSAGVVCYLIQFSEGLKVTGMSRDISWGLYIAQFTYLVGIAAGGVMVVLPYYLHDYKAFGKITILGEFLAIGAVVMCLLFIFVDIGNPVRMLNVILYPSPNSILFWDMIVLNVYLMLNIVVGWNVLAAERKGISYKKWVKFLAILSIPWAFSIHTVTAFLYAGIPGKFLWMTAIMAARFLASAFAAGPSLLLLLCLLVRRNTKFDPGKEQMNTLSVIITYAMILNCFFLALEFFTAYYSGIPEHHASLDYLFFGLQGKSSLVPWMWTSVFFCVAALILLVVPSLRRNETTMALGCAAVIIGTWIDKGVGLVIGGFIPNSFHKVIEYSPTLPEIVICAAIWATGFFIITILFKIAISIKEEVGA
ncbi:MAG: polysulfide reductase NrfD [Deltaproteobacteria bacterium]|nr:polysulfide reductase NrfD [Deltaproteobacteria bacterium]MBW2216142.1 polysulfide reductase NrfD [Deltaproteobacteria bacterium]